MGIEAISRARVAEGTVFTELGGSGNIVVLFQGQGSQEKGMGQDIYNAYPVAKQIYDEADRILGYPISTISFENTDDKLEQTRYAQLAILIRNHAQWEILKEQMPEYAKPAFFAGLSLGELNAYIATGAVSFQDMLKVVDKRAEAMQKACEENPGGYLMVTVRPKQRDGDLSRDEIFTYARALKHLMNNGLQPASINAPFNMTLAGKTEAIRDNVTFLEELNRQKDLGATILFREPSVAGPFHTALMLPAVDIVREAVEGVTINHIQTSVIANTTGRPVRTAEEIRKAVTDHVANPIKLMQSVNYMKKSGVDTFVEIGGKAIVTKMIRTKNQTQPQEITVPGKEDPIVIASQLVPLAA